MSKWKIVPASELPERINGISADVAEYITEFEKIGIRVRQSKSGGYHLCAPNYGGDSRLTALINENTTRDDIRKVFSFDNEPLHLRMIHSEDNKQFLSPVDEASLDNENKDFLQRLRNEPFFGLQFCFNAFRPEVLSLFGGSHPESPLVVMCKDSNQKTFQAIAELDDSSISPEVRFKTVWRALQQSDYNTHNRFRRMWMFYILNHLEEINDTLRAIHLPCPFPAISKADYSSGIHYLQLSSVEGKEPTLSIEHWCSNARIQKLSLYKQQFTPAEQDSSLDVLRVTVKYHQNKLNGCESTEELNNMVSSAYATFFRDTYQPISLFADGPACALVANWRKQKAGVFFGAFTCEDTSVTVQFESFPQAPCEYPAPFTYRAKSDCVLRVIAGRKRVPVELYFDDEKVPHLCLPESPRWMPTDKKEATSVRYEIKKVLQKNHKKELPRYKSITLKFTSADVDCCVVTTYDEKINICLSLEKPHTNPSVMRTLEETIGDIMYNAARELTPYRMERGELEFPDSFRSPLFCSVLSIMADTPDRFVRSAFLRTTRARLSDFDAEAVQHMFDEIIAESPITTKDGTVVAPLVKSRYVNGDYTDYYMYFLSDVGRYVAKHLSPRPISALMDFGILSKPSKKKYVDIAAEQASMPDEVMSLLAFVKEMPLTYQKEFRKKYSNRLRGLLEDPADIAMFEAMM